MSVGALDIQRNSQPRLWIHKAGFLFLKGRAGRYWTDLLRPTTGMSDGGWTCIASSSLDGPQSLGDVMHSRAVGNFNNEQVRFE